MDTSHPIQPISPGAQDTCMDTPGHPKPAALAPGGTAWTPHPPLSPTKHPQYSGALHRLSTSSDREPWCLGILHGYLLPSQPSSPKGCKHSTATSCHPNQAATALGEGGTLYRLTPQLSQPQQPQYYDTIHTCCYPNQTPPVQANTAQTPRSAQPRHPNTWGHSMDPSHYHNPSAREHCRPPLTTNGGIAQTTPQPHSPQLSIQRLDDGGEATAGLVEVAVTGAEPESQRVLRAQRGAQRGGLKASGRGEPGGGGSAALSPPPSAPQPPQRRPGCAPRGGQSQRALQQSRGLTAGRHGHCGGGKRGEERGAGQGWGLRPETGP